MDGWLGAWHWAFGLGWWVVRCSDLGLYDNDVEDLKRERFNRTLLAFRRDE